MKEMQSVFPKDLYTKHLSIIGTIHFTTREIDVIACIINARKTSKIASLLSINIRTVETHIRNIMFKLKCNSQEGIIDFIETSDKLPTLRKYYTLLRHISAFEKSLLAISKLHQGKSPLCLLLKKGETNSFTEHLESHLKLAGIRISTTTQKKEADYTICILPKTLGDEQTSLFLQKIKQSSNKTFFVLQEKNLKELPKEISSLDIIDFKESENYCFSFFDLLKKLLPNLNFETIISDFRLKVKTIPIESRVFSNSSNEHTSKAQFKKWLFPYSKTFLSLTILIIGFIGFSFLTFQWYQKRKEDSPLRSDLILPKESVLLKRPDLIKKIEDKLKGDKGIETVALVGIVGMGGVGKTTLARLFGRSQKALVIYEINAENRSSLISSFKDLGEKLAHTGTESQKEKFNSIQKIQAPEEKEKNILSFVKEVLKEGSSWILIYDNVESLAEIKEYFPQDVKTWGNGKVIITTRNNNIKSSGYINSKDVIQIDELDKEEALSLFSKIFFNCEPAKLTQDDKQKALNFLKSIPPFPLDISIAAYYLKATNASYAVYLENIAHYTKDFVDLQESLLKESGEYIKTRYGIITASLQHIINTHKDFQDLLLLISLIDSQNIPRDLLGYFKDDVIVDNFIFNLKKYSLLTNTQPSPYISLHRNTQAISLAYLTKMLDLKKDKKNIEKLCENFWHYLCNFNNSESFVRTQDFSHVKLLIQHIEAFLNHKSLLTDNHIAKITGELGSMYDCLTYFEKALNLLKTTLATLEKINPQDNHVLARTISHLGILYWSMGQYERAQGYLEQSITLYTRSNIKTDSRLAKSLVYLGLCYAAEGNFEKALDVSKQSLILYKKHFPKDEIGMAFSLMCLGNTYGELWQFDQAEYYLKKSIHIYGFHKHVYYGRASGYLGSVYRNLGRFKEAKKLMEETLVIYKKFYPKDGILVAWALRNLGSVYADLKDYKKAKDLLEQSIKIYRNILRDNNIRTQWALFELGRVYINIGLLENAKNIFEKNLIFYEENYKDNYIWIARILRNLGQVYLLEDNIKVAEPYITKALDICKQHKISEIYISYEQLADFFLKKSSLEKKKGNIQKYNLYRDEAILQLRQAIKIIKTHFPKSFAYRKSIQEKLAAIKKEK